MRKIWLLVDVDELNRAIIAAPLTARHALPILDAIGIDAESSRPDYRGVPLEQSRDQAAPYSSST